MNENSNVEIYKPIIDRYLKRIYPLAYYLVGCDSDKAYEVVTSSFVDAFMSIKDVDDHDAMLKKLVASTILASRNARTMPSQVEPRFVNVPPEKKKILLILKDVLQSLSFVDKALILLRDQIHLSYFTIGSILGIPSADARTKINEARVHIRKKMESALL